MKGDPLPQPTSLLGLLWGWKARFYAAQARIVELEAQLAEIQKDNAELNQLFDLQTRRYGEADKLWRVAHNRPNVSPDLGDLIGWLIQRGDRAIAFLANYDHLERCDKWIKYGNNVGMFKDETAPCTCGLLASRSLPGALKAEKDNA